MNIPLQVVKHAPTNTAVSCDKLECQTQITPGKSSVYACRNLAAATTQATQSHKESTLMTFHTLAQLCGREGGRVGGREGERNRGREREREKGVSSNEITTMRQVS